MNRNSESPSNPVQFDTWRTEIRNWLEANAPSEPLPSPDTAEGLGEHRAWEHRLHDAGYAAIHWPRQYGGSDASPAAQLVFQEEYERARCPQRLNIAGLRIAGPTLMHFGTDAQKERWLAPILSCEDLWCQGFSEPGAGSDLAGLRTSALPNGSNYVVNGQKTWTSGGANADWMFALVRTNPSAPKHKGITVLMIDLSSPGVDVRPMRQIDGRQGFSEVFLTNVEVPDWNVVGRVDKGWYVAMKTLELERGVGGRTYVTFLNDLITLRKVIRETDQENNPIILKEFGRLIAKVQAYRNHVNRTIPTSERANFGSEASFSKLYWSTMQSEIFEFGLKVLNGRVERGLHEPSEDIADWVDRYWYARATRIFAGTDQIQRNLIAERALGLPKEPRP